MTVNLTYETLFELLRLERTHEEFQELDKEFFSHVRQYLKEKRKIVDEKGNEGLFGADERAKTIQQLDSIKMVLSELYKLRERKIINLALHASRTGSEISTKIILSEEKEFYEALLATLNKYRTGIIQKLLNFEDVQINPESVNNKDEQKLSVKSTSKLIRFSTGVPKFVSTDLNIFGPFKEDDIVNLPNKVADVIIKKNRATEIKVP